MDLRNPCFSAISLGLNLRSEALSNTLNPESVVCPLVFMQSVLGKVPPSTMNLAVSASGRTGMEVQRKASRLGTGSTGLPRLWVDDLGLTREREIQCP
jgi:hypothetical protein